MILELTHRGGTAAFASLASDLLLTKRTAFFVMQTTDIVDEVQAELRRLDIPHTKITGMTHPKVGVAIAQAIAAPPPEGNIFLFTCAAYRWMRQGSFAWPASCIAIVEVGQRLNRSV